MSSKQAIILSLADTVDEIQELTNSLGYHIDNIYVQHRDYPDATYFFGKGKIEEIKRYLGENENSIDLIVVNGELKPSQWFQLEQELNVTVQDRLQVILTIFEERAVRKEARLQVRLAQLRYERPFVRELIHRARTGEHPGFMAGGEYQVDDYYEMIKRQMKKITIELEKIRSHRSIHRQARFQSGFYLISLAGYTNAGKSSLLNLLTDEHVTVEGRMFSTLSTTTRKIRKKPPSRSLPILLTDTVGFIQDLPSWIIDAFHSTLEEIELADLVLLIIDASESYEIIQKKIQVSLLELIDLNVTAPIILVFNKADTLTDTALHHQQHYFKNMYRSENKETVWVSTKTHLGIQKLNDTILLCLPHLVHLILSLPASSKTQSFLSTLHNTTKIIEVKYGSKITVELLCNQTINQKIISQAHSIHGTHIVKK